MSIVDAAFAALPRALWSDGQPLIAPPADPEAAHYLRHVARIPRQPAHRCRPRGLPRRPGPRYAALQAAGWSIAEIAASEGIHAGSVSTALWRHRKEAHP